MFIKNCINRIKPIGTDVPFEISATDCGLSILIYKGYGVIPGVKQAEAWR